LNILPIRHCRLRCKLDSVQAIKIVLLGPTDIGPFSLSTRLKLAQWLFLVSGIVHAALYPLSVIAITIGFWRHGFWHGLVTMLLVTIATVGLRFVIVGAFAALITLLDPAFFQ
jgi:hypothetical protein